MNIKNNQVKWKELKSCITCLNSVMNKYKIFKQRKLKKEKTLETMLIFTSYVFIIMPCLFTKIIYNFRKFLIMRQTQIKRSYFLLTGMIISMFMNYNNGNNVSTFLTSDDVMILMLCAPNFG